MHNPTIGGWLKSNPVKLGMVYYRDYHITNEHVCLMINNDDLMGSWNKEWDILYHKISSSKHTKHI